LTAVDVYSATFAAMVDPLPPAVCNMDASTRAALSTRDAVIEAALDLIFLAHRDMMYERHLSYRCCFDQWRRSRQAEAAILGPLIPAKAEGSIPEPRRSSSFRIAAQRQVRNPYPRIAVMDSGLLASLGPGMTGSLPYARGGRRRSWNQAR